jgi:RNA polymerase sigma-B factor
MADAGHASVTAVAPSDVAAVPSPSRRAQEDAQLFARYRQGGDEGARAELVARFLPLAKRLARGYGQREEYDDLVQVASFALLKAIDRYDPARGLAFSTYAVPTITGELKRHFRDHSWAVRPPRDLQDRSLQVQRTSDRLATQLGRSPTPSEIAEALDISVEHVLEALQTVSAWRPDRLDGPADPEDEERGHPTLAGEDPAYEIAEATATLAPLLARLRPREAMILRMRFEEDLTQSEIGSRLGLSQMHVSRILRSTLTTLRTLAESPG